MRGICGEKETTHAHLLGQALVHLVRTDVHHPVLVWTGVARQDLLKLFGLPCNHLLAGQARSLAVRDPPEPVIGDTGGHVPMLGMDDEIGLLVAELFEVVVGLEERGWVSESRQLSGQGVGLPYIGRHNLLVPRPPGEVPIAEKRSAYLAISAVAANDIVCFHRLLSRGGVYADPSLSFGLADAGDLVVPEKRGRGLL